MIRCNLKVILAEKNLTAKKISADTGISRTTLSSLVSNNAQGVQFDTINTLCNYLKIPIERLLSHVPIDIKIKSIHREYAGVEIYLSISENGKIFDCSILGSVDTEFDNEQLISVRIDIYLYDVDETASNEQKEQREKINDFVIKILAQLPEPFIKDVENKIIDAILSDFDNIHADAEIEFEWNDMPWV
jgi:DNA-binding Xre family transcriptional regulator